MYMLRIELENRVTFSICESLTAIEFLTQGLFSADHADVMVSNVRVALVVKGITDRD